MTSTGSDAVLPLPVAEGCPLGPPAEYGRLRVEEPVSRVVCPTGITAWLVTRYADVREVLGDPERFSARPGQLAHAMHHLDASLPVEMGNFSRMDGPEHLRFRRFMAPEVTARKRIEQLQPMVQRIVDGRIDALADVTPPVDLRTMFAQPATTAVVAELIGVPEQDYPIFQSAAEMLVAFDTGTPEFLEALGPLLGYLHEALPSRRAGAADDAFSRMIRRSDTADEPLADLELILLATGLLIAGYETTASMITYGLLTLLDHPEQFALLRDDPALARNAANELVRYLGVGTGLTRQATRDTQIGGRAVSAGDYVVVSVQSANRDPDLCAQPDRLDVTRAPSPHLGFGHGPHQCVGEQLALLEITTVLATLARRIPSMRLAVPRHDLRLTVDRAVYGPDALPVTWDAVLPGRPAAFGRFM
jgi:cytochrome P450